MIKITKHKRESFEEVASAALSYGIRGVDYLGTDPVLWLNLGGDSYRTIAIHPNGTWTYE